MSDTLEHPASVVTPLRSGKPFHPVAAGRDETAADWMPPCGARLGAFWAIKRRFPLIGTFLGADVAAIERSFGRLDGILGWGGRLQARAAQRYAQARRLPYWTLEDGFLRSVGLGKAGYPAVSMVVDDLGVHHAPDAPSRLEQILQTGNFASDLIRARDLRARIVHERLTKYNHFPETPVCLPASHRRRILVVDQVRGDGSLGDPALARDRFRRLWMCAVDQHDAEIVVKAHPDAAAGLARGCLSGHTDEGRIHVLTDPIAPHAVLDVVDEVWTVSSQMGLDALLRGIPVVTFGAPAYAGWGLTDDRAADEAARGALMRRTRRLSVDELVAGSLIRYPLYVDPVQRKRVPVEKALDRLVAWRARALELKGLYVCVGFSWHKRRVARQYLQGPWSRVAFSSPRRCAHSARHADRIVIWGSDRPDWADSHAVTRVEDGFIRSVGLGAALVPPASLCFDHTGLHYDAGMPSDLERILNTTTFSAALLARAAKLRRMIVSGAITKYNLPKNEPPPYRMRAGRRPIVVVGAQVPDDMSLRRGLPLHASNLELLAAVRRRRPDAFIVYKDHPDLVFGHRPGRAADKDVLAHADLAVGHADLDDLLDAAQEIHVATSQLGFDALLRGRPVFCHGVPFYGGWGLTTDFVRPLRSRRKLSIEELVAGALIVYPRYVSPATSLPCEVEDLIDELMAARTQARHASSSFIGRRVRS